MAFFYWTLGYKLNLPNVSPGSLSYRRLPPGDAGSFSTLNDIKKLAVQGTRDWDMRQTVLEMIRDVPEKDKTAEAYAIHNWVQRNVKYVNDPVGVEQIVGPPKMLEMMRRGINGFDCDDMVAFEAAALRTAGIPVDFVIIKADPRNRNSYSHIYLVALDTRRGKPIHLDPIMKNKPPGWEPPTYFNKKYIKFDGVAGQLGLGRYEHERLLLHRYVPHAAMTTGTAIAMWNNYLARKRHYYAYAKSISKAFDKDVQNIYKDKYKTDLQKDSMLRDMAQRREARERQIKERHDPKPPPNIPTQLKIQFLENQNKKLADSLYDLQEIKKLSVLFRQIGEQYLQRLREEQLKIERRALRRKKHFMRLKIMRMAGEIALQFVPYVGTLASTAGAIGNKLYEIQENAKEAKWFISAVNAANAYLGPGTSEVYLLNKADEIDWKVKKVEDSVQLKMEFNEWLIERLKKRPVIEGTPSDTPAVAAPRVMSTKAKVAIGASAAGLLALAML